MDLLELAAVSETLESQKSFEWMDVRLLWQAESMVGTIKMH
jgi:hypothetical protein